MRKGRSSVVRAAGLLACVTALLLAFHWFAAELTAIRLADDAGRVLQALRHGHPRWQWRPRTSADLVAGRVFGDGRVRPVPGGLEIASLGTAPFELGLPVAQRLDLAHWPILAIASEGDGRASVSVLWRDDRGTACLTLPERWLAASPLRIDLRRRPGLDPQHHSCPLPTDASMLRLRIAAPVGTTLVLQWVALEAGDPTAAVPPAVLHPDTLPAKVSAQVAALDGSEASPVVWLPADASAEQQLGWRDQAMRRQGGAIVVRADRPPRVPRWSCPGWLAWLATASYLTALGYLARRPRGDLLTLTAAFAGPLWLIAGLQWGERVGGPAATALGAALAFAAWASRSDGIRRWQWVGDWKSAAWWTPLLLVPVALLVDLLWGHGIEPVKPARALVYLGWATMQQWLLLGFALPRLERILPCGPWAILCTATLFALMHTPNAVLMQLCLLAELVWAACFSRTRSLLPVAVAHAASALVAGATLVGPVLRSLEVSGRFFL